jgi:hypothetical protein
LLNQIAAIHGVGAPAAFSPLDLPNLKAWYDASDTSSISVTSTKVTQWNDKSGNAYHLTQGTDAYRPNSGTRTVNSLNAIDYNTNTDTLIASTASNWKFMNDATGSTAFVVYKLDATPTADPYVFLYTRGGSLNSGPGYAFQAQTTSKMLHAVNITNTNICINISTSTMSTSTVAWTVLSDPNNATAANKSDWRKNTGSAEKNNVTTGTPADANPVSPLRVGDYEEGGQLSIDGLLCEIVICSGLLGASDITETQDYLIAKWGI